MDTSFALGVCFVLREREINKRDFFLFFTAGQLDPPGRGDSR